MSPDNAPTVYSIGHSDHNRCHRTLLITPSLLAAGAGARVIHIRPDGETVEAKSESKQRALF